MRIFYVEKDSVGEELGLKSGDEVIAFDNHPMIDVLDYEFYDALDFFILTVKSGEEILEFEVEKDESETLGLVFNEDMPVKCCRNKCLFCFIDQLPKVKNDNELSLPLRKTLFVKDDDYRHSFVSGTYVTLTNLTEEDLERIIRLRLSPLYISVHSTSEQMRLKLLGIKKAMPILPVLKRLHDNGICFHAQIVYCPEINEDLEQSINDLEGLAETLAIVPVGLTKYKNPMLKPVESHEAEKVLDLVEKVQNRMLSSKKSRFVWAADEFFIKAGRAVPHSDTYEGYPQIENGVGLISKFDEDFCYALESASGFKENTHIATGASAFEIISHYAKKITDRFGGNITVHKIENKFFGESVTVTGLLTGRDIYNELKNKKMEGRLVLSSVMLREFSDRFLDDMTVSELSKLLNIKIDIADNSGEGFVQALTV